MTTKKPVATLSKTETKAADVKAAPVVEEKAVEVKETAKKAPAKKAAAKTTAKKTAAPKKEVAKKETAKKETAKKETATEAKASTKKTVAKASKKEVKIAIQFADKNYTSEDLANIANDVWVYDYNKKASELKDVQLYVKPEESKVYYVFNNEIVGDFNI